MAAPITKLATFENVFFSCKKCVLKRSLCVRTSSSPRKHFCTSYGGQASESAKEDEHRRSSYQDGDGTLFRSHRSDEYDKLYPGHIPTSLFQKGLLAAGSGVTAFFSPWRDDMVHYFGETTGYLAVKGMRQKMMNDVVGKQILREKPRINTSTVDLDYLSKLPPGTLGRAYSDFLQTNKLSPDHRKSVSFIDDVDLAYTMTRYREVHDLVHTVLGMPVNMLGEVVVKWVEAIQTGLPMCVLGAMFSPLRFGPVYRRRYLQAYWAWSLRVGMNSRTFMNIYFEHHWEEDLEDLKQRWNIEPVPRVK